MVVSLKTERFEWDMGDYLGEKSLHIIEELAAAFQVVDEWEKKLPPKFTEWLMCFMSGALYDATKVLALGVDAEWSVSDPGTIRKGGREGLYDVLVKYGLGQEAERLYPEEQQFRYQAKRLLDLLPTILELLDLPRGEARPQICSKLNKTSFRQVKHPHFERLQELTEAVTQGELDWSRYQHSAREAIYDLSRDLEEQLEQLHTNRPRPVQEATA